MRLLETTLIRVGNEEYARTNGSFGLTTLRDRHVDVDGATVPLPLPRQERHAARRRRRRPPRWRGSSSAARTCRARSCSSTWTTTASPRDVDSADVNDYLREIAGEDFTAKDFRTWAGTVLAALGAPASSSLRHVERARRSATSSPRSSRWPRGSGNTPAVCRKCYVHPAVIEAHLDGTLRDSLAREAQRKLSRGLSGLTPEEAAVLAMLTARLS